MIGLLLDRILSAAADAAVTFFMSAERERAHHAARHPDQMVYAPPIVREHARWPHQSWPGGHGDRQRPYQPWPGGGGR